MMIKYLETQIVFTEIPDEITLAINITNCPCNCANCHSQYLAKNIGIPLTVTELSSLIKQNEGITCVAFMGGDSSPEDINKLAEFLRENYSNIKIGWYSGKNALSKSIQFKNFDFIKLGEFREELGPLTSPTTNQKMYQTERNKLNHHNEFSLIDITFKFWKKG